MNCKTCGGSTIQKQTSSGVVYECNQDFGQCRNPKNPNYPTSTWADSGQRPRRAPAAPQAIRSPVSTNVYVPNGNRDADIKWQVCLKVAKGDTPEAVLAFATKLFLAPIPKPPPTPKPAPRPAPAPAPEPEPEGEEVY